MVSKLKTRFLDLKTSDGVCDAYVAHPDHGRPSPAVILMMDAFGPRPYLYEMANTMAAHGLYVLLPNLFYRDKRAPLTAAKFPLTKDQKQEVFKEVMPLAKNFQAEWCMRDADAHLDFLSAQPEVKPGKRGIAGYCMGGRCGLVTAADFPTQVGAVASFHAGQLASENPMSPHKLLRKIHAQIYVGHADHDSSMPPEQIEKFAHALKESGIKGEAEVFSGAAHGFTMMDLPEGNEAALHKHWTKLFELFDRTIGHS